MKRIMKNFAIFYSNEKNLTEEEKKIIGELHS